MFLSPREGIWNVLTNWAVRYDIGIVKQIKACLDPLSSLDRTATQSLTSWHNVKLSMNVLFVDIEDLEHQIRNWIEPIRDTAEMLLYFCSRGSELFRAALQHECQEMRELRFQQSPLATATTTALQGSSVPVSKEPGHENSETTESSTSEFDLRVSEL